ncbi:MAG: hypothetical protein M1504_02555 [Candidatus Marsarchaeota archaeon]|nr:hypothetical protein [Candidatus Marsarchaeota archaeon]
MVMRQLANLSAEELVQSGRFDGFGTWENRLCLKRDSPEVYDALGKVYTDLHINISCTLLHVGQDNTLFGNVIEIDDKPIGVIWAQAGSSQFALGNGSGAGWEETKKKVGGFLTSQGLTQVELEELWD